MHQMIVTSIQKLLDTMRTCNYFLDVIFEKAKIPQAQ